MAIEYSIPELLQLYGLRGYMPQAAGAINRMLRPRDELEYRTSKREATRLITGYDRIDVLEADFEHTGDLFGLPVFMPLTLEAYEEGQEDLLLDSAIVEISRQKNVVVTVVQGRDTSVKEFVNNGDFQLRISGMLASNGPDYPTEQLTRLNGFLSHKGTLKVVNEKLNKLGIYEIVVTDYAFPAVPFQNIQPYTITAISDEPVELILDEL